MTAPPTSPIRITVVEAPGCHFCTDARELLERVAAQRPDVEVRTLDVRQPEGQALMRRHRAGMSPLVLVDGAFVSQGRLSRGRLAAALPRRAGTDHLAGRAR